MSTADTHIHHANIIISKGDCRDMVFKILKDGLGFDYKANPDFWLVESASFGIDEARSLEKWAIGKPLLGEIKTSLIITKSITFEAQNALLKVLEEPTPGTYFFICMESLGGVLPTFLSRVRILDTDAEASEADTASAEASKFFRSGIKERFSIVRSMSKKEDREDLLEILKELEAVSYESYLEKGTKDASKTSAMKDILIAKTLASVRGSSPKMLLEWLSCVL